jgi:hypothetical protein
MISPLVARVLVLIHVAGRPDLTPHDGLAHFLMNCWLLDYDDERGNLLVQVELEEIWRQLDLPPACGWCSTPLELHRKFNHGNPIDVWLPDCECDDDFTFAKTEAWLARRQEQRRR